MENQVAVSEKERTWAMLCHLLALSGYITGLGFILGPLVVWLLKREGNPFVDKQGKEALNFQINMMIHGIISSVLCFVLIGFLILPIVILTQLILTIVAAVKANEGISYRYPMIIRFF